MATFRGRSRECEEGFLVQKFDHPAEFTILQIAVSLSLEEQANDALHAAQKRYKAALRQACDTRGGAGSKCFFLSLKVLSKKGEKTLGVPTLFSKILLPSSKGYIRKVSYARTQRASLSKSGQVRQQSVSPFIDSILENFEKRFSKRFSRYERFSRFDSRERPMRLLVLESVLSLGCARLLGRRRRCRMRRSRSWPRSRPTRTASTASNSEPTH